MMILSLMACVVASLALGGQPSAGARPRGPEAAVPLDWRAEEAPFLSGAVQLTFPERFTRAGEAYFDHQVPPRRVIFQAIAVPKAGETASPNYAMYVATIVYDAAGAITGLSEPVMISPAGSANTCGWFHPRDDGVVLFGSTVEVPKEDAPAGYSKDRSRYQWQFPKEMGVVAGRLAMDGSWAKPTAELFARPNGEGYAAECSWSPDGRLVLYTYRDPRTENPDLWIYDTVSKGHTALVTAKGYNGGGFFTPDGRGIIYRSDRRGDSNLQLYIAPLAFGADGAVMGVEREFALTDDLFVNWAPFVHPRGGYLVFASSELGHQNYEVLAMQVPSAERLGREVGEGWAAERAGLKRARVTVATGFDGLPVFSGDGAWMMWTSQRGGKLEREERPSSQLWAARVTGEPAWRTAALKAMP